MSRTFEDITSGELDALYQGALFLSGGDIGGAERLLVDAVTLAFREHAAEAEPDATRRWLEARLVRAFLRLERAGPTPLVDEPAGRPRVDPAVFESFAADDLFRAARRLPAWPRAILWLVLFRRWSYADAARVLDVDIDVVQDLLGYRDVLMREMIGSGRLRRTRSEASQ